MIDVAQEESVTRKLSQGKEICDSDNMKESDAVHLESSATPAQAAQILLGRHEEAQVLVSLVRLHKLGEITGPPDRDKRVIARLNEAMKAPRYYDNVLSPQAPSTFSD